VGYIVFFSILFLIVLIALPLGLVLDAYLLDSLTFIFPSPEVSLCLNSGNGENIKETKGTGSKNSKEVDQHVVLGAVDQSKRGGWQLPVGTANLVKKVGDGWGKRKKERVFNAILLACLGRRQRLARFGEMVGPKGVQAH